MFSKSNLILFAIILFGALSGFITYKIIYQKDVMFIHTVSFDRTSEVTIDYSLATDIDILEGRYSKTDFSVEDYNDFITNYLQQSNLYYKLVTSNYHILNEQVEIHYIISDGYYYQISESNGKTTISNVSTVFETFETELYFPFINDYYGFGELSDNFYSWDNMNGIDSFDDMVYFYKNMDSDIYIIDDLNKTISLKVVDVNINYTYSIGYPIVLHITLTGIEVEFIESEI